MGKEANSKEGKSKEAKIGVVVILFLLVTFCTVLVWRLSGSSDKGTEAAAAADETSATDEVPRGADLSGEDAYSVAKPANATLVEANSGEPPEDSPPPVGQWNMAMDEPSAPAPAPEQNAPSLSYMPMPPEAEPAEADDSGGEPAPQMAEPAPTWQQQPPPLAADPAAHGGAYEPLADGGYATPPPADPSQQEANRLRLVEPPPSRADYAPADRSLPAMPVARSRQTFAPPPAAAPARTEDGKYTVQPNDSFWVISKRLYGTGAYFKALAEHNRDRFSVKDQLAVGDVILAPSREELDEIYPGLCPEPAHREVLENRLSNVSSQRPYGGRTYVVQEGDSLFNIARYELGKASRWVEIYQLNRHLIGSDHDYLPPGVELVLPDDAPADRMTQQPDAGSTYRR